MIQPLIRPVSLNFQHYFRNVYELKLSCCIGSLSQFGSLQIKGKSRRAAAAAPGAYTAAAAYADGYVAPAPRSCFLCC